MPEPRRPAPFRRVWKARSDQLQFERLQHRAGAVAHAGGATGLGPEVTSRLPLESPVLAAIALAMWVGVPFAVLALHARRGTPFTDRAALVAGILLVAWILVQLAIIRTPSPFQLAYLAIGLGFVAASGAIHRKRGGLRPRAS